MDKEDILKRSREQKEDEGVTFTENKGRRFGVIGFSCIFIIIMLFNIITKHDNFVPFSMFFAYMSAEAFGKYSVVKSKAFLSTTILAAVASILFLICYIMTVLGVGK